MPIMIKPEQLEKLALEFEVLATKQGLNLERNVFGFTPDTYNTMETELMFRGFLLATLKNKYKMCTEHLC
jgi:hypothetical protein